MHEIGDRIGFGRNGLDWIESGSGNLVFTQIIFSKSLIILVRSFKSFVLKIKIIISTSGIFAPNRFLCEPSLTLHRLRLFCSVLNLHLSLIIARTKRMDESEDETQLFSFRIRICVCMWCGQIDISGSSGAHTLAQCIECMLFSVCWRKIASIRVAPNAYKYHFSFVQVEKFAENNRCQAIILPIIDRSYLFYLPIDYFFASNHQS